MIQARTKGNQVQSDRADARAASLAPILTRLRASGVTSLGALAAALTARNIPTLSGRGSWSAARVHRLVRRIARLEEGSSLPAVVPTPSVPVPDNFTPVNPHWILAAFAPSPAAPAAARC